MFQIQRQDIIVQVSCPTPNGTQILSNAGLTRSNYVWENSDEGTLIALFVFWIICFFIVCLAFIIDCCRHGKKLTKSAGKNRSTPNTP